MSEFQAAFVATALFSQSLCQNVKLTNCHLFFLFVLKEKFPIFAPLFINLNICMKRYITIVVLLMVSLTAFSQDKQNFFHKFKDLFIVHDTVYIYLNSNDLDSVYGINYPDSMSNDTISNESDDEFDEMDEESESIPVPFDTIDTENKFRKIVLFDNGSWVYYDLDMPVLPDTLDSDHWDTDCVHTYRDIALKDIRDEIDLKIVDSIHGFCIPHPGEVVSTFKWRKRRPHKGVDINLNTGDAVYAAFDGIVRVALPTRMTGGYGNVVVIRHANGLETYYGHLSKFLVKSGDVVRAGEMIGYGGSTGRSTGPHLHFETRYMGQAFDPERIFDFEHGTLRSEIFTWKKHYTNINSHYGQSDKESVAAAKKSTVSSNSAVYYRVKKGDTLTKIAQRNGTTVKQLCKLNGIKETKLLQIGQKLRVR